MFYIIGLILVLGLIFGSFSGLWSFESNPLNLTDKINSAFTNLKSNIYNLAFPKSKNEILIDNLKSNYNLLDRFFSDSSDTILNSKDISNIDKEAFLKASEAYEQVKDQTKVLGIEAIKNTPGIVESLVKKVLNISSSDENTIDNPDPTYIPPNCNLVCTE